MSRHYVTRRPVTAAELQEEGPAVRVRDLHAITGISVKTILADIKAGELKARPRSNKPNAPWLITRPEARAYAARMGALESVA